ncbi:MAG: HAD-IIB family hydrolase [Candidatus Poribacteria bacterium]|nr:HAD-IIB family hydrolase [Candidatus Poribacteria bacterium]
MPTIGLVAIDIDGTLVNSKGEVSEATKRECKRLHRIGVVLVLATGRRYLTASRAGRELGIPILLGVHNGAALRELDGTLVYSETLDETSVREACRVGRDAGAYAWVYQDYPDNPNTRIFCEPPETASFEMQAYVENYHKAAAAYIKVVDDLPTRFIGEAVETMLTTYEANGDHVIDAVTDALGERASVIKEVSHGTCHVEVAHPKVSKALPLTYLAERHGLTMAQTMAVGDNFNDLDMLRVAGHPVVMGNARPALKEMGFRVAPTNDEDGLAQVLAEIR